VNAVYLPARAKLNLVLRIVGRRADGYHLLETLFHALELHDDLWVMPQPSGCDLEVSSDAEHLLVPGGPDNLVVRALQRLVDAVGCRHGFRAHLHKRIPHGGGLGGGSSDAAAALRLANQLLEHPLDAAGLQQVAVGLGADVPFFLRGGSKWGHGIGEELQPAQVPPLHFVLLLPPFGCPTVDVYKNHAALWIGGPPQVSVSSVTVPNIRDSAVRIGFRNDLEPAAERVRPELAVLRRRVADLGHSEVRMTGSGSTLFVACADGLAAERCVHDLDRLRDEGIRLVVTRSAAPQLDQAQHAAWPESGSSGSFGGALV
jgi:4-diphosphocytidyl-2-C-methyl-D-erythritol kinase